MKIEKTKTTVRGSVGEMQEMEVFSAVGTNNPLLLNTENLGFSDVLEGVAIAVKPIYFASPYARTKSYWHLDVPEVVSLAMNADKVNRLGNTGHGIRVTMVDTGWQPHPYFSSKGYDIQPRLLEPGAVQANIDSNGHGTAESANIFAAAPDVSFRMVKMVGDAVGSFNMAAMSLPKPHIITCSWGFDIQNGPLTPFLNTLAAAISSAVANGITVVFSAGNGHFGFPGQQPYVISAGGTFLEQNGNLRASDYTSGFLSSIYAGRKVPDVCGLVGMKPKAAYIMLPLPEGCDIDTGLAGNVHPNGDETTATDRWAAISGTSAAAPQIAGVCALIKKKKLALTPLEIKKILMKSAIDVKVGSCFNRPGMNHAAVSGPDLATGAGLVDAFKAVSLVV